MNRLEEMYYTCNIDEKKKTFPKALLQHCVASHTLHVKNFEEKKPSKLTMLIIL